MTEFDVTFRDDREWVSFGQSYVTSEGFKTLFREGMLLVEETAAYLDGEGRSESRLISRDATLAYASESMRLTTRLMQIASWLLVQRAVSEGEISLVQAQEEKTVTTLLNLIPNCDRAAVAAKEGAGSDRVFWGPSRPPLRSGTSG